MRNELKPCPFCGGEAHIDKHKPLESEYGQVMWMACCNNLCCTALLTSYFPRRKDAIAAWNRRANDE